MLELHPSFGTGPSTQSQPGRGHAMGSATQAPQGPFCSFGRELKILLFNLYWKVPDKRGRRGEEKKKKKSFGREER